MNQPLLVDDVARALGVSRSRVVALDDRLQPERTPNGTRVYRQERVDEFAGWRAQINARKTS